MGRIWILIFGLKGLSKPKWNVPGSLDENDLSKSSKTNKDNIKMRTCTYKFLKKRNSITLKRIKKFNFYTFFYPHASRFLERFLFLFPRLVHLQYLRKLNNFALVSRNKINKTFFFCNSIIFIVLPH